MSRTVRIIKDLQLKAQELRQQYADATETRRLLLLREGLLSAMCDSLCFLQVHLACSQDQQGQTERQQQQDEEVEQQDQQQHRDPLQDGSRHPGSSGPGSGLRQQLLQEAHADMGGEEAKFRELLETEAQLLQQLSANPARLEGSSQAALQQLMEPEPGTISPCTDPMQCFHRIVSLPWFPGAATMTAEDVARNMQHTSQAASFKLHKLAACCDPSERQRTVEQLAAVFDSYWHCLTSLILLGRNNTVEQAANTNLDTMAYEPVEAAQHQQSAAALVAPLLGLSEQQQQFIAVGAQLLFDLLAAINQERRRINADMTAAETDQEATSGALLHEDSSSDARGPTPLGGGSSSSREQRRLMDHIPDRQGLLEKQQELAARLDLLMHKEYKLRFAAMGWFVGTLTYEQLARYAVLSHPYAMRPMFLAAEVMQRWQQES